MTRTDDLVMERLRSADPLPHDDLDRLLRETAMPDLPASPAGRRAPARRGRRVLWGAATAAAVAGVAGVLVVSLPRGEERAAIPGRIGILDRPATDADRLPEWVRGEQMLLEQGVDRDAARLAASTGTHRYYVAPAVGGTRVCLVDVPVKAPPLPRPAGGFSGGPNTSLGGIQCADRDVFSRRFMLVVVGLDANPRRVVIAGVVPDGYDTASLGDSVATIRGNVFVLQTLGFPDGVIVTGPAGERTAYHGVALGPYASRIPDDLDPTVSVFDRPARGTDRPPAGLRAVLDAARMRPGGPEPEAGTERRVASAGRTTYWLIRDRFARRGPRALLAMVNGRGATLRPIVLPTRAEPFRVVASTLVREPYGPTRITLRTIVPDGFTSAVVNGRTFPVRNNFLLIRGFPVVGAYRVELRGPAGAVMQTSATGSNEFRLTFPTNIVPYLGETVVRARAARAGLQAPYTATIVAALRSEVARVLGNWAVTLPDTREQTVPVVAVRSGTEVLVLVLESTSGPDRVIRERRYRADQVPDLSVLGRVRPLKLD